MDIGIFIQLGGRVVKCTIQGFPEIKNALQNLAKV